MESLSLIVELLLLPLAIITIYYLKTSKSNIKSSYETKPPQPQGAWPIIGHLPLLGGRTPVARTLAALADKHGPIFSLRLGSHQALVVSNSKLIKECFTTWDRVFATRPKMAISKYMGYNSATFALAPYGPYWRNVRKLVTLQLLTNHRLDKLRPVRATELDSFIKTLYSLNAKKVTLNTWFENLTFNVIIRMLAGKRFSSAKSEDLAFKEAIKKGLYLSGVFVWSDTIPWLEWMDIGGHLKSMKQTAKEIDIVLQGWVENRINNNRGIKLENGDDFLDVMLSTLQENEMVSGYTRETVIKSTLFILILTGSESTAETLIWALSLLLNNKQTLKIAQEEIDTNIGCHKWVQESDIHNLKYLQAIVKETLRLYPPGPLAGPHEATEDCHVGHYYVPKGTRLIVNLWKLHRDPHVWSNPDEFRPERFLNEHSDTNFRGQCFEYIPFSSGRRMCPGMTFGLQLIQLTLARLLQGFDISTPMGAPVDMEEGLGIALPKLKPLEVILTPRLPLGLYHDL